MFADFRGWIKEFTLKRPVLSGFREGNEVDARVVLFLIQRPVAPSPNLFEFAANSRCAKVLHDKMFKKRALVGCVRSQFLQFF
ncbi:MAG: hypothetical protein IJD43_00645 [Thermoguttaceae bacterium]|nr:hypothetical protein [Thermoguttaceae bacterium]